MASAEPGDDMTKRIFLIVVVAVFVLTANFVSAQDSSLEKRIKLINGHKLVLNGEVYEGLMNDSHKNCSSSCYDCLRDYYNQQHHALLNWRIALDLAALANDAGTKLRPDRTCRGSSTVS